MTDSVAGATVEVGPYRLLRRLGEGGMGVVHLALDRADRPVALKVLRAQVAADPDARRRLAREVETLRRIRHPNVAQVLDADVDGALPYVVTAFVPGRTLEDHVRNHGPLPAHEVTRIGRRVAEALATVHAVGVVHRDLKPANVMLPDGEPMLIDFGIAHLVDETRITMTGLVMGTPGFLSPEVLDGHPVTAATDWWGWGATLAYAATGRPPFGNGSVTAVLDRVRRGAADLAGIEPALARVIGAALVIDPAQRSWAPTLMDGFSVGPPALPQRSERHEAPTVPYWMIVREPSPNQAAPTTPYANQAAPTTPYANQAAPTTPFRPPAPATTPYPQAAPPSVPPTAPSPIVPSPTGAPSPVVASAAVARGGLLFALLTVVLMAAVVPGLAVVLSLLWLVAARTVDRSVTGLLRRRYARGPRSSDTAATVAALPGRLLLALWGTVWGTVIPVLLGVSVAFVVASAANGNSPRPNQPLPLAAGMAAAWLGAWWGPGGGGVRRSTRAVAWRLAGLGRTRIVVAVVLALACLAAVLVLAEPGHGSPDWTPLRSAGHVAPFRQLGP